MKRILVVGLAALALAAPPAAASHTTARCVGVRVGARTVTGSSYQAVLFGVAANGTDYAYVRCVVLVNGSEVASSPSASGPGAAATTSLASWSGSASLCVEYGDSHEHRFVCGQTWVG